MSSVVEVVPPGPPSRANRELALLPSLGRSNAKRPFRDSTEMMVIISPSLVPVERRVGVQRHLDVISKGESIV